MRRISASAGSPPISATSPMTSVWLPRSSALRTRAGDVAGGSGERGDPIGSDLRHGVARHGEDGPVRGALDFGHRLHEAPHHVAVGPVQQRDRERTTLVHQTRRDGVALERHTDELRLHAHLDHEVGRHQVDLVPGATADQVQPRRERPQHAPAMAVELLVGRGASSSGAPAVIRGSRRCPCCPSCPGGRRHRSPAVDLTDPVDHLVDRARRP